MKKNTFSLVDLIMIGLLIIVFLAVVANLVFTTPSVRAAADDTEVGKATYQSLCISCHGESGKGDGPVGQYLTPKPADLAEEIGEHDNDYIFKVIKEGGASVGKSPTMPAWGAQLNDDQVRNVISYLKTFVGEGSHK
jgi:mono/diheme cytochrome c family protein